MTQFAGLREPLPQQITVVSLVQIATLGDRGRRLHPQRSRTLKRRLDEISQPNDRAKNGTDAEAPASAPEPDANPRIPASPPSEQGTAAPEVSLARS
jgi:hypothetical protein